MNHKTFVLTIFLIAVILVSLVAALYWPKPSVAFPEFYVGVEMAYQNVNVSDVRSMVDRVKSYTNFFVIGSVELKYNESALDESCDYIHNAGLKIIVLLTNFTDYSFDSRTWTNKTQQKFGDDFLALYRYDEPGGNQWDSGVNTLVGSASSYSDAASKYTDYLGAIATYYRNYSPIFTADYALQWFDYKSNYSAVFTELGSNNTREIAVAESLGGAASFGAD